MSKITQVIPAMRLKRNLNYFDYAIPEDLIAQIKIGQVVEIPFRNQNVRGVVLNLKEQSFTSDYELKFISKAFNPQFNLSLWQLELIKFIADYYFVSMAMVLKMILPEIPKRKSERFKDLQINFLKLPSQRMEIENIINETNPLLINYTSFNYKISAYLEIIKHDLELNKQTLIIVPEFLNIADIYKYLGEYENNISVLLNDLPKNKFWQEWLKIKNGQAKIILGTRSAIFAPFNNLGTIIIDEEDNINHKQEEPNPRYNVKTIAVKLAELTKAKLVFSALTPSIDSLYKVQTSQWKLTKLHKNMSFPQIIIIDRHDEFKKGNYSIFSEKLLSSINQNINNRKKTFLFINRKGAATLVTCKDCGYIAACPTCKLPLTYHKKNAQLHCHHCDYKTDLFLFCPKCKSHEVKLTGIGTEKVEQELRKLYPNSKIAIIDKENPHFNIGADIIIGTQLALNYIDWTKIQTIGVVNADTLFYLPDYKSLEKTYNLLRRLAILLSEMNRELICQTMVPENYVFSALKQADQQFFYNIEIKERADLHYPPVGKLIKLIYQSLDYNGGQEEINVIYNDITLKTKNNKDIIVNPPQLAYTQQVRGRWRWQIIIKITDQNQNLDFLASLPENLIIDIDPENLL